MVPKLHHFTWRWTHFQDRNYKSSNYNISLYHNVPRIIIYLVLLKQKLGRDQKMWILILALPLDSYLAFSKSLLFLGSSVSLLQMGKESSYWMIQEVPSSSGALGSVTFEVSALCTYRWGKSCLHDHCTHRFGRLCLQDYRAQTPYNFLQSLPQLFHRKVVQQTLVRW